jgi:hypothetical protein
MHSAGGMHFGGMRLGGHFGGFRMGGRGFHTSGRSFAGHSLGAHHFAGRTAHAHWAWRKIAALLRTMRTVVRASRQADAL